MKRLWNQFGHSYLSRIETGTLHVTYPDNSTMTYGNGEAPRVSLHIHDSAFFMRLALYGDIGFAESYMDGEFDSDDLASLIKLALLNSKQLEARSEDEKRFSFYNLMPYFNRVKHLMRKNSKTRSQKNISDHYDLSNDFFTLLLDESMMYSGAIFDRPDEPLSAAQRRKIETLAKKLNLKPGSKVLEIGSGWGAMAMHLAKTYRCEVKTLTLSKEQKALCEARFREHDVDGMIEVLLKDYRDMEGTFDAIIAVEMFEAVGREYFDIFFKKCESLLKPSGVLVMQIITMPDQRYEAYCNSTDFIQKYIFPGGHLPSVGKILETTGRHTRLNLQHMEEFTEHYAKTLRIWHDNFNEKIDDVRKLGFDDYFIRMWRMYLAYCEAAFITRNINLVQVAFTRDQNTCLNEGLVS
ncbi:MAG: cyclopropane-fatty-acyl-phospholipid synthase family protein [Sulfurimonadaceae bacterium]|nr:cyclopropane-fatty-acyl-phospholipid synthase family protein [Sulfurimonadaceae bacterium]